MLSLNRDIVDIFLQDKELNLWTPKLLYTLIFQFVHQVMKYFSSCRQNQSKFL